MAETEPKETLVVDHDPDRPNSDLGDEIAVLFEKLSLEELIVRKICINPRVQKTLTKRLMPRPVYGDKEMMAELGITSEGLLQLKMKIARHLHEILARLTAPS